MMTTETYLQKAWGEGLDSVTIEDVRQAISETIEMDDEHGAFWVGIVEDEEIILEAQKDLFITLIYEDNLAIKAKLTDWTEIEEVYKLFLEKDFNRVKTTLEANSRGI